MYRLELILMKINFPCYRLNGNNRGEKKTLAQTARGAVNPYYELSEARWSTDRLHINPSVTNISL